MITPARAACLLVIALAILPLATRLDYPLLHDDRWAVLTNPNVVNGFSVFRVFATDSWGGQPGYPHMHYRPLPALTTAATAASLGVNPAFLRAQNVLFHVAVSLLVLFLLWPSHHPIAATAAASFFAIHPVHVEAVMFIVNREELLATLFSLSVLFMLARPGAWPTRRLTALALLGLLAMASKETAVCLPLVAFGMAFVTRPRRFAPTIVLLCVAVVFVALRAMVLERVLSDFIPWQDNPLVRADWPGRIVGALAVAGHGASLLLAPLSQTVDYGWNTLGLPAEGVPLEACFGALVIIAVVVLIVVSFLRKPAAAPGLILLSASYAPVSNFLFLNTIILAERNLYLPSAGLAMALAAGLDAVCRRPLVRAGAVAAVLAWVIGSAFLAWDRASDFASAEQLYASSLANRPGSTRLHNDLGVALQDQGRLAEAEREFRTALAIDPENAEAHNNLGTLLHGRGELRAALAEYMEALRLRPGMVVALGNLCNLLVRAEDHERALLWCEAARRRGAEVGDALRMLEEQGHSKVR